MNGQWMAEFQDRELTASIRIDLEDRGHGCFGNAYLFYPKGNLPGFQFPIRLPSEPPFKTTVNAKYLYPWGGLMTQAEREADEARLGKMGFEPFGLIHVDLRPNGKTLTIVWSMNDGRSGTLTLLKSDTGVASLLEARTDLKNWADFREWAVTRSPRNYIFRGQRRPHKLVSSFYRTWRKDLNTWITDDAQRLYGAVLEQLSFPLQIGNLHHNAAIWSILQHHGYPTPLIDWSLSPFVAAYFALEAADQKGSAPRIYIFDREAWDARYGRLQFIVDAAPNQLITMESMPISNPRHIPQRAITTVTNVADVESFIRGKEMEDGVTYLSVCDIPVTSRPQIMRELELMGITHGSLFPGLDGICRDMKDALFSRPGKPAIPSTSNHSPGKVTLPRWLAGFTRRKL